MRRSSFAIAAGALFLALTATPADAQTTIGFKLGASMSKLSIDGTTEDTDWKTGFMGGGFIRFGLGRLGLQPEILSVTKGAEASEESGDVGEVRIEYVALPVLLHVPLTYGSSFAPFIVAGPEFAFDIGCDFEEGGVEVDCDDAGFERKSLDIGLTAGGGFAFAVGPGALMLEGRYTHGLTNVADAAEDLEWKNRSIYITAGYSIPLGR